jgi:glycosyltransferase involved in cell wall biosynthesis
VALVVGQVGEGLRRHLRLVVDGLAERGVVAQLHPITGDAGGLDAPLDEAPAGLRRALRAEPVDVVHAYGLRAGLVAALARRAGDPLVVTWYARAPDRGMRRYAHDALARAVTRAADVILCGTAELEREALALGARKAKLAPVLAPALPPPVRDPGAVTEELGLPPGAPMVLSVGRLSRVKRFEVLVDAAARWRELRPAPVVVIAGTGPSYRHLVARAALARARVQLVGERDDVAELLQAAELVVIPGSAPFFHQEALASGVAVVSAGEVDALDEAVRELLADPDRRSEVAAAGRALAASWPTPAQSLNHLVEIYGGLVTTG